jgi:signal transduction histidine kinase
MGEAQDALRADASPEERRRSLEVIAEASRGLAREVDGLLLLARGDAAPPGRKEDLDFGDVVEESLAATASLGSRRRVVCAFSRNGPARLRASARDSCA